MTTTKSLSSLFLNTEMDSYFVTEIYHALIEYIKSGEAINDMGHPDFLRGASGNILNAQYSSYSPKSSFFQIVKSFSEFLLNHELNYVWYRELNTWKKYCQFIVELHQINLSTRTGARIYKSWAPFVNRCICPSCGLHQYDYIRFKPNDLIINIVNNHVFIDCERCGQYSMQKSTFKRLDTYELKAKLFVYLVTRNHRHEDLELVVTNSILNEIFQRG